MLTLIYFLQGVNSGAPIVLALLGVVLLFSFTQRIAIPFYFILIILVYLPFLIIGISNNHTDPQIDIKFQLFYLIFWLALIQFRDIYIVEVLYIINALVLLLYIALSFNLIPNFWSWGTFGLGGRMYGPPIISVILLLFFYVIKEKPLDWIAFSAFIIGLASIVLTTNFMNLIIVVGLFLLLALDFQSIGKTAGAVIVLVLSGYVFRDFLPDILASKMNYLFRPWEYASFQMRIIDLVQVLGNTRFDFETIFFGEGFGATSRVFRVNTIAPSLSGYYNFHEIDNGFYYVFHRGGLALLLIFFLSHYFLLKLIPSLKGRLALALIVLVTNLLTIHYFTYLFYLLIPYLIIKEWGFKRGFLKLDVGL